MGGRGGLAGRAVQHAEQVLGVLHLWHQINGGRQVRVLLQQRDISYSETIALAKEAEEALLYRNMQTDLVQQLLRRLAAVRR